MNNISFEKYCENLANGEKTENDIETSICFFPDLDENISLFTLSKKLNSFTEYTTKKESYTERLNIRNSEKWKTFTDEMRKEKNYVCEVSNYTLKDIRTLNEEIFHIPQNKSNVNNWLNVHHKSGEYDYECYDKEQLLVVNRAIHMTLHMYKNLVLLIPTLKNNYRLWFELGSLIQYSDGSFPWKAIK